MFSWLKSLRRSLERDTDRGTAESMRAPPPEATLDGFEALLESGQFAKALEASNALPPVQRRTARYLRLEGWLSYELGHLSDALKRLQQAIAEAANDAHAHALVAAIHMRQGRSDEALSSALKAEALGGRYAWLRSMVGVLHHGRGDIDLARQWFRKALELDPARGDAIASLAAIAFAQRAWGDLLEAARRMTEDQPEDPKGWSYLGTAQARTGADEEAERSLLRAIELGNASVDSQRDYASFLINCGRIDEARRVLEEALHKDPEHALLHTAHAQCRLILDGSSKEAWREYEWRLRLPGAPPPIVTRWHGEPIRSGVLHIVGEQGMGDMLLFARLLPEVLRRCERVKLELPAPLVPLFRASAERFGWAGLQVLPLGMPTQAAGPAQQIAFMSLMHVLGPALPSTEFPYLLPNEARERLWKKRMGPKASALRVALVWSGNAAREDDILRSIPPAALAPLAEIDDVEFVSLQKEAPTRYLRGVPMSLLDFTSEIRDFEDSAAIVRQSDLVLSIDTAAAHLAGALGMPCWLLLPRVRDWRWEMGGTSQPWYPHHQTWRADRNLSWEPLLQSVAKQLIAAAAHGS